MMNRLHSYCLVLTGALLLSGCATSTVPRGQQSSQKEKPVDAVGGIVATGKPTFIYFVKESCGSSPRAVPLYTQLAAAYKGRAQFLGVIDADENGLAAWKTQFPMDIEFRADPEINTMRHYQVASSQTVVLVDEKGKELDRWSDFGKDTLASLNQAIAKQGGASEASVDLSRAPEMKAYG